MQLFEITFSDANTVDSGSLNNWSEISFKSTSNVSPKHSTSCMPEIPLKSRDVIPENKSGQTLMNSLKTRALISSKQKSAVSVNWKADFV